MTPHTKALLAVGLLTIGTASTAVAQTERTGTTAGGAHYMIVVPDAWNGDLVIWNHGFSLSEPDPLSDAGPLSPIHLQEGYAVAASSYQQTGWALFKSARDLEALVKVFSAEFGAPGAVILYGASLGGLVTANALEKAKLGNVTGAFTFCGVMAGSRNWDVALDHRLLYDRTCAQVPSAAIPGGAKGLPKNTNLTEADIEGAVNACFGLDRRRGRRSAAQKKRLKEFRGAAQIPENFIQTNMGYVTFGMSDLVYDRSKMRGKLGTDNKNVDYGSIALNRAVERVAAKKAKKRRLTRNYTPSGRVGNAKIISLHTDKDGLVIVENESEYAKVVPANQLTVGVVVEKLPSHCDFSISEVVGAWEALRQWLESGNQPSAADLQSSCRAWQPFFGGDCRIDQNFRIPDMDGRVRPR